MCLISYPPNRTCHDRTVMQNTPKRKKTLSNLTITECFLAGALGLELHSLNFVLYFTHIFVTFTVFSQPFIPIFRTIFLHFAQPSRAAVRELFPLWRFFFCLAP